MKKISFLLSLFLIMGSMVMSQYFTKVAGVLPVTNFAKAYSASWGDYNNDGLDDLIVTDNNKKNTLFKNMGSGVFQKDTLNTIFNTASLNSMGTCWGDYNNDGNLDLLIVNTANAGLSNQHNYLFRNDGNGSWTLITNSPVYTDHGWGVTGTMVDYDKDGFLDIYVANFDTVNFLYHNNGNGTFSRIYNTAGPIVTDIAHTYTAVWADYDNDGWPDCYVVNYFGSALPGENNALYHNNHDGTFSKDPSLVVNNDQATDQSASWGDYDNDGYLDLFTTVYDGLGVNHNFLYHNNGDGTFTFMSSLQPSVGDNQSYGSAWLDFNNDGKLDLVVANNKSSNRHNFLYRNDGNGVFTNISTDPVAVDLLRSMGISVSDYDNDGYPDIYIDSWSSTTEPGMYHNVGGTNNWLQLKLTGTISNRSAIGSRITLWSGGQKQIREIQSATGIYCSSSLTQTFGLGAGGTADSVVIKWPSGIIQHICNPTPNQKLLITEAPDPVPTGVTSAATSVTPVSATLNGSINPNCSTASTAFQYGLTTTYGSTFNASPISVSGTNPVAVSCSLSGLIPNTTYHSRVKGTNGGGSGYGNDIQFTTTAITATVTTTQASSVGTTSASLNGTVLANNSPTTVTFDWGPTTSYGNNVSATPAVVSGMTSTVVNAVLSGLSYNTLYHFRCHGTNQAGTAYGQDQTFTTGCPIPTAPGSISGPASVCRNLSGVVYSVSPIPNASNYAWTVPAGVSIVSGAGTNTITVNITTNAVSGNITVAGSNVCSTGPASTMALTVNVLPVPTITGSTSMCEGSGYYFYVTEPGQTGYTWTVSPGGTVISGSGTSNLEVFWSSPGAQSIGVNYTNASGCSAQNPTTLNIAVNAVPSAAGTVSGPSTLCAGTQGAIYSVNAIAGATYYVWNLPAGAVITTGAGTNAITVDFPAGSSSGNITVAGNNLCGNGSTSPSFPVAISAAPSAPGNLNGPASVCKPQQGVTYSVNPVPGALAYTWTVPSGATITSGTSTNSIIVNFSGSAASGNISVYASNNCGNGPASSLAVTVNAVPPSPLVTANGHELSSSASTGNQWYHNGSAVAGATGQTYSVPISEPGSYWTIVTVNACSSDTSNHVYIAGVGIQQNTGESISVYPVPNDGSFNVKLTCKTETTFSLAVFNELGVEVYNHSGIRVDGTAELPVDLRPVPPGVYTLVLSTPDQQLKRKILVK